MKYRIKLKAVFSLLTLILIATFSSTVKADNIVLAGFDLFQTAPGTKVNLPMPLGTQDFRGVPLGTFDFGMGAVATFNTDTIVQRLGNATAANPTVAIQLVALQLMSVNQVNLGAGDGFLFVTLQSARGGPASLGTITINGLGSEPAPGEPHGTFSSSINVYYDIRFGSLDGPIIFSSSEPISQSGGFWSHFAEPGIVQIPGVNTFPNAANNFFPLTGSEASNGDPCVQVIQEGGITVIHQVCTAKTPEPTTIFLLGAGLFGVAAKLRLRSKAKLKD